RVDEGARGRDLDDVGAAAPATAAAPGGALLGEQVPGAGGRGDPLDGRRGDVGGAPVRDGVVLGVGGRRVVGPAPGQAARPGGALGPGGAGAALGTLGALGAGGPDLTRG